MKQMRFFIDDEQHTTLMELAHTQTLDTGKRVSMGELIRQAIDEYLARQKGGMKTK